MPRAPLLLLVFLVLGLGCSERAATQVLVHFDAQPGVRAIAARLRVRIFDVPSDAVRYDESRALGGASPEATLPATVPVVPRDGDPTRRFRVLGELQDDAGVIVSTVMGEQSFVEHTLVEVTLLFEDPLPMSDGGVDGGTCVGCPCTTDSCVDGECVPTRRIVAVGAGGEHTCAVDDTGALLCFGVNDQGQLGIGVRGAPVLVPTQVTEQIVYGGRTPTPQPLPRFGDVDPSTEFSCGRDASGAPFCWGRNNYRQLGLGACCPSSGEADDQVRPELLPTGGIMRRLSTGGNHACGISETMRGRLYCWGRNDVGQASDADRPQYSSPRPVGSFEDWLEVSLGEQHTCAIRALGPGSLYCFGEDADGRLGANYMGVDQLTPRAVGGSWLAVSAGSRHTCAIALDGRLFCFGRNNEGQLGVGDTASMFGPREVEGAHLDWTAVSAGYTHTCAIRDGGRLFCWGANLSGELGVMGAPPVSASPLEVGSGYVSVSAGQSFTCTTSVDARLYCFGSGAAGKLGTGDTMDAPTPALVCFP